MVYSAFLEEEKDKAEIKEKLDTLEIQLARMQNNIKQIAKKSEVISIDRARDEQLVVIYADKQKDMFQLMLHDCQSPFRGKWHSAIQAEFKGEDTLHIADIKGEQNKGYGSVLMEHLKEMAREENIQYITGDIVVRDFDHVDRLTYFYHKHDFNVKVNYEGKNGRIVWNDY
ncbi:GNAT family N-acetyltransferase [Lentibacillus sp. N15]|uniref:GNAT family N-acetyltransferase n=1 Tax=Lentibacillus songyuanensis TaxID=3136161 RepID=UPI0031BB5D53